MAITSPITVFAEDTAEIWGEPKSHVGGRDHRVLCRRSERWGAVKLGNVEALGLIWLTVPAWESCVTCKWRRPTSQLGLNLRREVRVESRSGSLHERSWDYTKATLFCKTHIEAKRPAQEAEIGGKWGGCRNTERKRTGRLVVSHRLCVANVLLVCFLPVKENTKIC